VQQFTGFNTLMQQFSSSPFMILAVPCPQFGFQCPGSAAEVLLTLKGVRPGNGYVPNFLVANKASVNGDTALPLYANLVTMACPNPTSVISPGQWPQFLPTWSPVQVADISWNFEKILFNKNGEPVRRYSPQTDPLTMVPDIKTLLV